MCVREDNEQGNMSYGLGAKGVVSERLVFSRAECLN